MPLEVKGFKKNLFQQPHTNKGQGNKIVGCLGTSFSEQSNAPKKFEFRGAYYSRKL